MDTENLESTLPNAPEIIRDELNKQESKKAELIAAKAESIAKPIVKRTQNPNPVYIVALTIVVIIFIVLIIRYLDSIAGDYINESDGELYKVSHNFITNSVHIGKESFYLNGNILIGKNLMGITMGNKITIKNKQDQSILLTRVV